MQLSFAVEGIFYVLTDCCGKMVDTDETHVHFASCLCPGYSCLEGSWEGLLICTDCSSCHQIGGCISSEPFHCSTVTEEVEEGEEEEDDNDSS